MAAEKRRQHTPLQIYFVDFILFSDVVKYQFDFFSPENPEFDIKDSLQ